MPAIWESVNQLNRVVVFFTPRTFYMSWTQDDNLMGLSCILRFVQFQPIRFIMKNDLHLLIRKQKYSDHQIILFPVNHFLHAESTLLHFNVKLVNQRVDSFQNRLLQTGILLISCCFFTGVSHGTKQWFVGSLNHKLWRLVWHFSSAAPSRHPSY